MPYVHIKNPNARHGWDQFGSLNNSLTVRELFQALGAAIKKDPSVLDKAVLLSDDEEGNCYHGCYYSLMSDPDQVKSALKASNWGDPSPDEYEHAIIIG